MSEVKDYPGEHEPFDGRLELLDGIVYEVDRTGAWWLTSDRHGQRLRRRPDRPTFTAGWRPGDARAEAEIAAEDYEVPVSYNVVAADGTLVLPGDAVVFLDRLSGQELPGVVQGVPGFVSVRTAEGDWYDVAREDVRRVTRLYAGGYAPGLGFAYTRDNLARRLAG